MNRLFSDFFPSYVAVYVTDRSADFKLNTPENVFSKEQQSLWDGYGFPQAVAQIHQIHTDNIVCVSNYGMCTRSAIAQADGLICGLDECALTVRTADCLSAFFYDPRHDAIGICHAGWKGTKQQISAKMIDKLNSAYGSEARDIKVAFGPCIRAKSYEVSADFTKYFPEETKEIDGKFYFDLVRANHRQLLQKGISVDNIADCHVDTFTDGKCFSFRKEADSAGRMLSIIYKKR